MGECAAVTCSDGPFGSRCTWRRRVHDPARVWMAVAAARLRPPNITGQLTSPGLSLNARACTEAENSNRFIR